MSGSGELKIEVGQDGKLWWAKEDGSERCSYGLTRDEAVYCCGWWDGRRELGEAVKRHVDGGATADHDCEHQEPAAKDGAA